MGIERLDGFTNEGFGNVIGGEPTDGDVIRIDGTDERRFYSPAPHVPQPIALTKAEFSALYVANGNDVALTMVHWPEA